MGIRIKKIIGYGLTDVKCKDGEIVDPRFNLSLFKETETQPYIGDYLQEKVYEYTQWILDKKNHEEAATLVIKANGEDLNEIKKKYKDSWTFSFLNVPFWESGLKDKPVSEFDDPFVHDGEYGNPKVCLFKSLYDKEVHRSDNLIDYYEADEAKSKVKLLTHRCGIYPFTNMIRIPGTTPTKPEFKTRIEPSWYNQMVGRWDKKQKPTESGIYLQDLLDNYRPIIEPNIVLFTHFCGIFTDWEKTVQELRPMIYTYWS